MKKVLKFLGILILLVIAFVLIAGLFMKKDYHFERSTVINAPRDVVWNNISHFENFKKWNPFDDFDPNIKESIEGQDGTVGAVYKWEGNKDVGSGSQTYTALDAPGHVSIDLQFKEPFESKAKVALDITGEGSSQKVTWGFDNHTPYPLNTMNLFMNMDKMMGSAFEKGLADLKAICEKEAAAATVSTPATADTVANK